MSTDDYTDKMEIARASQRVFNIQMTVMTDAPSKQLEFADALQLHMQSFQLGETSFTVSAPGLGVWRTTNDLHRGKG